MVKEIFCCASADNLVVLSSIKATTRQKYINNDARILEKFAYIDYNSSAMRFNVNNSTNIYTQ